VCTTSQLLGPLDEVSGFYRRGCYNIPIFCIRVQLNMYPGFGGGEQVANRVDSLAFLSTLHVRRLGIYIGVLKSKNA
jgi:hypothetical protein